MLNEESKLVAFAQDVLQEHVDAGNAQPGMVTNAILLFTVVTAEEGPESDQFHSLHSGVPVWTGIGMLQTAIMSAMNQARG